MYTNKIGTTKLENAIKQLSVDCVMPTEVANTCGD